MTNDRLHFSVSNRLHRIVPCCFTLLLLAYVHCRCSVVIVSVYLHFNLIIKMSGDAVYIASVVATYWFVSISMVYLNKVLMSNDGISIDAPLFVTWYQCIITAIICWAAGKCGERAKKLPHTYSQVNTDENAPSPSRSSSKPSFFAQFPKAEFSVFHCQENSSTLSCLCWQ